MNIYIFKFVFYGVFPTSESCWYCYSLFCAWLPVQGPSWVFLGWLSMGHACSLQVCPQFFFHPQKLNEVAASLFVSCEEAHVSEGVSILNELIIPCMHLMNNFEISKEDLDAIEAMRNRWCSYLGREDMDGRKWLLLMGRVVSGSELGLKN